MTLVGVCRERGPGVTGTIYRWPQASNHCHNEGVEPDGEDQWSWWESIEEAPPEASPSEVDDGPGRDPLRTVLIAIVFLLAISLAITSYLRFVPSEEVEADGQGAAETTATTTASPSTTTASPSTTTATTAPTTTATTATTAASTSTTTAPAPSAGPAPAPPTDVEVVETRSRSAEIHWASAECVGSRYQVGDFEPRGGGYPNVDRCWFDHVVLAGDPSFSPPLEPDTDYVVRIQAVREDGTISDPVEVVFRTTAE